MTRKKSRAGIIKKIVAATKSRAVNLPRFPATKPETAVKAVSDDGLFKPSLRDNFYSIGVPLILAILFTEIGFMYVAWQQVEFLMAGFCMALAFGIWRDKTLRVRAYKLLGNNVGIAKIVGAANTIHLFIFKINYETFSVWDGSYNIVPGDIVSEGGVAMLYYTQDDPDPWNFRGLKVPVHSATRTQAMLKAQNTIAQLKAMSQYQQLFTFIIILAGIAALAGGLSAWQSNGVQGAQAAMQSECSRYLNVTMNITQSMAENAAKGVVHAG
jgi:hypothetical protein